VLYIQYVWHADLGCHENLKTLDLNHSVMGYLFTYLCIFETGFCYVFEANLRLTMEPRLDLNSVFSCLILPSVGIVGMYHPPGSHCFRWRLGFSFYLIHFLQIEHKASTHAHIASLADSVSNFCLSLPFISFFHPSLRSCNFFPSVLVFYYFFHYKIVRRPGASVSHL
jgi:hypothetical protein